MMRRRRPLMRAAMVGGGAYVAGKHVAANQQREADQNAQIEDLQAQQAQQQAPQAAPPPPPPPVAAAPPPAAGGTDIASKLVELKGLMDQGVLTQEEFDQAKQKLLAG
jgi:hemolysin activation/secretion protein